MPTGPAAPTVAATPAEDAGPAEVGSVSGLTPREYFTVFGDRPELTNIPVIRRLNRKKRLFLTLPWRSLTQPQSRKSSKRSSY